MKRLDYDEVVTRARRAALRARLGYRRGSRNRPRDPDQWRAILELDRARLARQLADGSRVRLGPRRWRLV